MGATECGSDPIDSGTRAGAIDIGFSINFFGTTYSNLYINTNGGIFFDNPSSRYDQSLTEAAVREQSSLISPLTLDLFYDKDESNLWVARTTIAGKRALVVAWEEFDQCCTDATPDAEIASFQFVFIDNGSGDFIAYFNYDKFVGITQGYDQVFDVDMRNAVTVGSNVVTVPVTYPLEAGQCVEVDDENYGPGSLTDSSWDNNANYVKLHATNQISVWQDSACTVPNNVSIIQTLPVEYVGLELDESPTIYSVGIGWSTFDSSDGSTEVTELFGNRNRSELFDGGSSQLISYSLNTTVPGRVVIGMSGGATVTENVADPETTETTLPQIKSDRLPFLDQQGFVLGNSAGELTLTGTRLYCTTYVKVNDSLVQFTHEASPLGNGKEALRIQLPTLAPGHHAISMDSCGGPVVYERFLLVPKPSITLEGKIVSGLDRANLLTKVRVWAGENRSDYNSVQCIVSSRTSSGANAAVLAQKLCTNALSRLASPKEFSLQIKANDVHRAIWYRIILSMK